MTNTINPEAIPVDPAGWQPDPEHPRRRPPWIKVRAPSGETYELRSRLDARARSFTRSAKKRMCPNIGECWGQGTATFLMMGDTCAPARAASATSRPGGPARSTLPSQSAWLQAVKAMNLQPRRDHQRSTATSASRRRRADLRDGDQAHPPRSTLGCSIEVLIPDFKGNRRCAGRS